MDALDIIDFFYDREVDLKAVLLKHSNQVKDKALQILENSSIKLDRETVANAALLHDIGIIKCHAPSILCNGTENYIAHGILGAEMLRKYAQEKGLDLEVFARIAERHTGSGLTKENIIAQKLPLPHQDFLPETALEKLICLADKFFSKSGSMQEKSLESIRRSMLKFGTDSLERFDEMTSFWNSSVLNMD